MRPEDILPDAVNQASIHGVNVRKGTVAAFLVNAKTFTLPSASLEERATAETHMREALPALYALGIFDVFELSDPKLREWFVAQR